ncbi:MAG: hypothetical protein ACN6NY_03120, partial [Acinetobacter faecalis]|uniref:hypothetical protein n=1 Tax=Acinetobacter faecalis TaxID=2665161 RepID=UPI003CFC07D7
DTGDLKSPAHKACQFESGLGHHSSTTEKWCNKISSYMLVFLCLKFIKIIKISKRKKISQVQNTWLSSFNK